MHRPVGRALCCCLPKRDETQALPPTNQPAASHPNQAGVDLTHGKGRRPVEPLWSSQEPREPANASPRVHYGDARNLHARPSRSRGERPAGEDKSKLASINQSTPCVSVCPYPAPKHTTGDNHTTTRASRLEDSRRGPAHRGDAGQRLPANCSIRDPPDTREEALDFLPDFLFRATAEIRRMAHPRPNTASSAHGTTRRAVNRKPYGKWSWEISASSQQSERGRSR